MSKKIKDKDKESIVEKVIDYHEKFDLARPLTLYRQGSDKSIIELLFIIRGIAESAHKTTSLLVSDVKEGKKIKKQTAEIFVAVNGALSAIESAASDVLIAMGIENLPLSADLIKDDLVDEDE